MAKKRRGGKNVDEQLSSVHGTEGIKKVDGEVEAPKYTIPTSDAALTVYKRLRYNNLKRSCNYQRIQGMIDGNPPYNPRELARAGLSDMCNVNWKDGEAVYKSAALAFWSLFNEVENIAQFKVTYEDENEGVAEGKQSSASKNALYGKILSEEWDKVIKSWPVFNKRMNFHQGELLKFGLNTIIWPDERDWRFDPVSIKDFYVPDQTDNDIEKLDLVCIENTYSARYLWDVYEKFENRENGEWNAEVLGDLLFRLANVSDQSAYRNITSYLELQQRLKNGDLYYDAVYNDDIRLVSIFVKEYGSEEISHIMIHPELSTDDFIYLNYKQYENIREALMYFTYAPGEEKIHANKGLGHSIFAAIEAITQLDCSLLDQARRSGSLLLKSNPARGKDERQVRFVHGGVIDIGEAEIAQNTMGNNIQATAEVSRYFRQKTLDNNNISGMDPAYPDRNAQAVKLAQMQVTKEARIQKNVISHYYEHLDYFFREIVRKMLVAKPSYPGYEYVEAWKTACIARGVPEEVFEMGGDKTPDGLPTTIGVWATRSAGSGSQVADQMEMQSIMQLLPTAGERGRRAILQDFAASVRGWRFVDRYFPPEDMDEAPTGHDTLASIENNQFSDGKQVIVSPDNNHLVHAQNHMRLLQQWMEMYQQDNQAMWDQETTLLQKVDEVFSVAGPHFIKHLLILSQDPSRRADFERLNAEWAVAANFGDMINNNAQAQREAQARERAEQQRLQAEQEAQNTPEHIKARGKMEVDTMKARHKMALDERMQSHKFALENAQLENRSDVERRKAAGELALKAQKTVAEMTEEETGNEG